MSNKMKMLALDKLEIKFSTKVETVVALDKIAKIIGVSRPSLINTYISDGLNKADIKMTEEDLCRVNEIIAENTKKRSKEKSRKGIK